MLRCLACQSATLFTHWVTSPWVLPWVPGSPLPGGVMHHRLFASSTFRQIRVDLSNQKAMGPSISSMTGTVLQKPPLYNRVSSDSHPWDKIFPVPLYQPFSYPQALKHQFIREGIYYLPAPFFFLYEGDKDCGVKKHQKLGFCERSYSFFRETSSKHPLLGKAGINVAGGYMQATILQW